MALDLFHVRLKKKKKEHFELTSSLVPFSAHFVPFIFEASGQTLRHCLQLSPDICWSHRKVPQFPIFESLATTVRTVSWSWLNRGNLFQGMTPVLREQPRVWRVILVTEQSHEGNYCSQGPVRTLAKQDQSYRAQLLLHPLFPQICTWDNPKRGIYIIIQRSQAQSTKMPPFYSSTDQVCFYHRSLALTVPPTWNSCAPTFPMMAPSHFLALSTQTAPSQTSLSWLLCLEPCAVTPGSLQYIFLLCGLRSTYQHLKLSC